VSGPRFGFLDLPRAAYPFTVEFFAEADQDAATAVWSARVAGPGVLVMPAMGYPVWCRMTYADGTVTDSREVSS
jgi:hypothetical protein